MNIPEDIWIHIIKKLKLKDLLSLRLTCKYFNFLSSFGSPECSTTSLHTFPRTRNPRNVSLCFSNVLEFFRIFPRTKTLKISFLSVGDDLINQILSRYLEEIDFSFNTKLTSRGLDFISKKCPKLKILKLTCCNYISIEDLKYSLKKFKNLKKLYLWTSYSVPEKDSEELSNLFQNVSIIYYPMFSYLEN